MQIGGVGGVGGAGGVAGAGGPQDWQKDNVQKVLEHIDEMTCNPFMPPDEKVSAISNDCIALQGQMKYDGFSQKAIDQVNDFSEHAISYIRQSGNPPVSLSDYQASLFNTELTIRND